MHSDIRHLLYHIYPRKGGLWQFNIERLRPKLDLFNGKRVVHIATDQTTEDADRVMQEFGSASIEFIIRPNHPLHETGPFIEALMPKVAAEPGVTFYAHAKGAGYGRTDLPFVRNWTWNMYHYNLKATVPELLEQYHAAGIYRRHMIHGRSLWHYSGTFFWFRNSSLFATPGRDWRDIEQHRYGVETYLGFHVPFENSVCLYGDNPPDLYYTLC